MFKIKINLKWAIFAVSSLILIILAAWINNSVTLQVQNSLIVAFLALSITTNIIILLIVFATGIGQRILKRFINRIKYNRGAYTNTLQITKNGTLKEHFCKVDNETGAFKIRDNTYVRNPKLLLNYDKIPTYIHREGNPDPLDIWDNNLTSEFSNAEIDIVMNSKGAFDVKAWLDKNKMIILLALGIMIAIVGGAAFFGYSAYEMLRDGTYTATQCLTP